MIMIMPGIGEVFVQMRLRLLIALTFSYVLFPVISSKLPAEVPSSGASIVLLILGEVVIGLFIGGIARLLQSVLHTGGMIMAFLSSLAAAQSFDPTQGSQGSVFGTFLTLVGITLFFTTDLHHLMLSGIADSYTLFSPGEKPPIGDFADVASQMLSGAFLMAFKIASPLIIIGLGLYMAAGVMGRLMPAMQVFFVLIPMQVIVSFNVLLITLSVGMMAYLNHFENSMMSVFYP
jgi:flagellar biosynthetic protein FliR